MASRTANPDVARLVPRPFGKRALHALLAAPVTDFETLNGVSRTLQNRLIRRMSRGFNITLPMVVDALRRPGNTPEVAHVVSMFLVPFLFREQPEVMIRSPRHVSVEDIARRDDDAGMVCRYFLEEEAEVGPTSRMQFLRGAMAYKRGRIETAYDHFDQARQIMVRGEPVHHHQGGVLSVRPMPRLREWIARGPDEVSSLTFGSDRGFETDRPILMAGFDPIYHDRYAARLLETGRGRVNLHLHVANPEGAALISDPDVRYSFEAAPGANSAYFASMRFLHLAQVVQRYGRPVLTIDADAQITGSPQPLIDRSRDHDVVLQVNGGFRSIVPWRHVIAQLLLCQPNDAAVSFLRAFRAQFDGLMAEDGRPHWWVDQALLASTMNALALGGSSVRVSVGATGDATGVRQGKIKN